MEPMHWIMFRMVGFTGTMLLMEPLLIPLKLA